MEGGSRYIWRICNFVHKRTAECIVHYLGRGLRNPNGSCRLGVGHEPSNLRTVYLEDAMDSAPRRGTRGDSKKAKTSPNLGPGTLKHFKD